MHPDPAHLSTEALLDYWLGDAGPAATDAADEHLMRCPACGDALEALIALGAGMRDAFRGGTVSVFASGEFVRALADQGLRVREYRFSHNGSVNCTAAPYDDVLVARLQAPLAGIERLDAVTELSCEPGVQHRLHDVPFDAANGEVVLLSRIAAVRRLPAHDMLLTLTAPGPGGEREIGRYTFHHRPWPADPS